MKESECTKDGKMAQTTNDDAETIARHLAESLDGTLALEPQKLKQLRREWNAARARADGEMHRWTPGKRGSGGAVLQRQL